MTGYHYTTWEAYQQIKEVGLQLSLLEERHKDRCREVVEFVEDGCIWVYPEFMQSYEQIGMIFYVAFRHGSPHLVCLEVDYVEQVSATYQASLTLKEDKVELTHDLEAGLFGHKWSSIDLITEPVPPEQIHLVGEWNLFDMVQQGENQLRVVA